MNDYLKKLIFRYLYIHSLIRQVGLIKEWETQDGLETLNIGAYFFELTIFSFSRTILLEIYKLVSDNEDKSLMNWLNKAKDNATVLNPSRYNPNSSDSQSRISLSGTDYVKIIDLHFSELEKHKGTIQSIKARRDKVLAHTDKAFFNDPSKLFDKYPLNDLDISAFMETINNILREHHLLLLHADASLEVTSSHEVDLILKYVRAYARVRKDKRVTHDRKIMVYEYLRDDYE